MEARSPVTLVAMVKKDLAQGGELEVVCEESVVKKGSLMSGRWGFYLRSANEKGEILRSQVVVWRTLEPKIIHTVDGLMAFSIELGVTAPVFPRVAGEKGIWRVERSVAEGQ